MKPVTKKQLAIIAGSCIIIVLLLFANKKLPENKETSASEHAGAATAGVSSLIDAAKATLTAQQKSIVQKLEQEISTATDKKVAYDQLIKELDSLQQPVAAAYFMEKKAILYPVEDNWRDAGNRYYMAIRFVGQAERQLLYGKAIDCFEKVMALNPADVETKISLASCFVEGSTDPMKGITMLREIEKTDSNNVNLQLNFAFFSEKSGQWDKAIQRFEKVLKLKPDFIEVYLHMADAYKQMGDKQSAIANLEKYLQLVDDVVVKTEVQNYINKLKNS